VSDQDFFFDEDEQPKPAEKATAPTKKSGSSGSASRPPASGGEQSVSMTVAVLIGVVTMLLGVIIGLFIGRGMATPAVVAPTGTGTTPQQQGAPQLSPEQLEGGQLPEGHPDIGGGGMGGSTETTGN
jgi:hypothetical protein